MGTRGSHFTDQNMKPTEIVTSRNLQNILVWTQAMEEGRAAITGLMPWHRARPFLLPGRKRVPTPGPASHVAGCSKTP